MKSAIKEKRVGSVSLEVDLAQLAAVRGRVG